MNDDVPADADFPPVQPDYLAKAAANAITSYGVPGCLLDAPAEPADIGIVWSKKDCKILTRPSPALAINRFILRSA